MSRLSKNCTIVKLISWIHLTELDDLSIRVFENLSAGISDVPRKCTDGREIRRLPTKEELESLGTKL